jgi:hypothetical protein
VAAHTTESPAMDRRRFQQALVSAAAGGMLANALPVWAQTTGAQPPAHVWLPGFQSLMEMLSRRALERTPDGWTPGLPRHLRDAWDNWTRFGPPKLTEGSPWKRYEAFESLARFAAKRLWELARDSLMLQAFTLTDLHVAQLQKGGAQKLTGGVWATAIFEAHAADRLMHRLLGTVVELHLAWLLENRDRYPRNPAARHAQIEAEDWEICLRATRAIVYAIFDAIAAEEREMRLAPQKPGTPAQVSAVLMALGAPPKDPYQPQRPTGGGPVEKPTPGSGPN